MKRSDCTIFVGSCDGYSETWDPFFSLLRKYWEKASSNYNIVLATELLQYSNADFSIRVIHSGGGKAKWTTRMRQAIAQIDSPYILFMLDDFFLYDYVNSDAVERCLAWMDENPKAASFTFWPVCPKTLPCDYDGFGQIPHKAQYKVNGVLNLWRKDRLLHYLSCDEDPWEWEINGTKRSLLTDDAFFSMDPDVPLIFPYHFAKYGIIGGKWFKETKALFDEHGIQVDYEKRGFFDERNMCYTPSVLNAFEIKSSLFPYYKKHRKEARQQYKEVTKQGRFSQRYDIAGASQILQWEPATYMGFLLKDLGVTICYRNGKTEKVDNGSLYGNEAWGWVDMQLVCIKHSPIVYIIPSKNKDIKWVLIEGEAVSPIPRDVLDKAFDGTPSSLPEKYHARRRLLDAQYYFSIEAEALFRMRSELSFVTENGVEHSAVKKIQNAGPFSQSYPLPSLISPWVQWEATNMGGFAIRGLKITAMTSDNRAIPLKPKAIQFTGAQDKDCHIFTSHSFYSVHLPPGHIETLVFEGQTVLPLTQAMWDKTMATFKKRANMDEWVWSRLLEESDVTSELLFETEQDGTRDTVTLERVGKTGLFCQRYHLPAEHLPEIIWRPATEGVFLLDKLDIRLRYDDGSETTMNTSLLGFRETIQTEGYIFVSGNISEISFDLPDRRPVEVIITGELLATNRHTAWTDSGISLGFFAALRRKIQGLWS